MALTAKAIAFALICLRARIRRKSSFGTRMLCKLVPRRAVQKSSSTIPSVAVLPFDDLSADQSLGYLGEGVAEDIITALSRFPNSAVVARTSSFTYKGKAFDIRQIGKELGVGYVVEGSVRKDGNKLRIVISAH